MSFNAEKIRAQFPTLERMIDGTPLHYLDNAATSQMPKAVLDAVYHFDAYSRANVKRGVHTLAEEATEAYENARLRVAKYMNAAGPEEIIFTSGTTGAINLVAHAFGNTLKAGDEILLSELEHHSNLVPWHLLKERKGITLKYLPVTGDGRIDLSAIGEKISDRTKLIAITHASNVTGTVTEMIPVTDAAKAVGAKVLVDGAQAMPHGPVDVQELGVDFYAFSAHKAYGPTGIGVLWARADVMEDLPPFLGGGGMIGEVTLEGSTYGELPRRYEAGTPPITQAVGMGAAIKWMEALDFESTQTYVDGLTMRMIDGLRGMNSVRLIGPDDTHQRVGVVSFVMEGCHPHDIAQILDNHGVAVRAGHHCAQPLMRAFGVSATTRASLTFYNNEKDVDAFLEGLDDARRILS